MELYKPSATLFLDLRNQKANTKFPLKLTIYCFKEKKRYRTNIDLSLQEWEKINSPRLRDDNLKEIKIKTSLILSRAEKILSDLSPFSFAAFEKLFFQNAIGKTNLSLQKWFDEYIEELESQGREGTRISYRTTFNSLNEFKSNLKLTDITKDFLEKYEVYMKRREKSPSTIGIYLRQLRAILNRAIEKGVLKQENYPFKSYEIPSARNIKKALNDEELKMLLNFAPKSEHHQKALDFWILSYLCNGMNFTDIIHLTQSNVNCNFLYFIRQKTIRTRKKDIRPIKVPLHPRAVTIINKWKGNSGESLYLFPILEAGLSPKTIKNRTQRFIKLVNRAMTEIGQELGIENKLGTYVARHSFSSRLMRRGVSPQFIKESLGHSSVAVTENYLGDFADSVKTEYSELLTTF